MSKSNWNFHSPVLMAYPDTLQNSVLVSGEIWENRGYLRLLSCS
jgi:hypothetical protein